MKLITTIIEVNSPAAGETLTASLFRLDGYGIVCSKTVTLTTATQYTVTFDLTIDPFLAAVAGPTAGSPTIYMAKAGDYTIQVADAGGNVASSPLFAVSIVPVKEITDEWAKGVTFYDFEVLEPRLQPQLITGVEVTEVSANHLKGPFPLTYTFGSPSTLAWNTGAPVTISGQAPATLLLLADTTPESDFIMVSVTPSLLPTASQTESLYIDNGRIKPRAIIDQVRRATSWVQQSIIAKVEPEIIDTDPTLNGYCDEVAIPGTYYRPRNMNKWMSFQIPYPRLLDLSVSGYFNQSKSAVVPALWLAWDEMTAICELVPSTGAAVQWTLYNSLFIMQYLYSVNSLPSFWHYRATVGLRDLYNERAVIREAIAKKAATELLVSAGSAYRAGFVSQSASRDGVSQSQGYTSSAMYGTYGGHYINYKKWLETEVPKMKKRFAGMQYISI